VQVIEFSGDDNRRQHGEQRGDDQGQECVGGVSCSPRTWGAIAARRRASASAARHASHDCSEAQNDTPMIRRSPSDQ
jgi:hypothetical protein